jgi:hypothetical protein
MVHIGEVKDIAVQDGELILLHHQKDQQGHDWKKRYSPEWLDRGFELSEYYHGQIYDKNHYLKR